MKTKDLVFYSLLITIALLLSYVESLIPNPYPIPGVKIGLTNIISVFTLFNFGLLTSILISVLRILLAGFLFGSPTSIIYALSGGLGSLLIMFIFYKMKFNIIATSTIGGISHNIFQLILACLVLSNWNLFTAYIFPLFISGILAGLFVGLVTFQFNKIYLTIKKRSL